MRELREGVLPAPAVLPDLWFARRDRRPGLRTGLTLQLCHPAPGGSRIHAPYAIAVVTLEEGPRMMTNIIDCPQTPEALQLDMPLKVTFREINETVSLPVFRPAGANRDA